MLNMNARRLTSVVAAIGLVMPASGAFAQPATGLSDWEEELDRIAPPIPVVQQDKDAEVAPSIDWEEELDRIAPPIPVEQAGQINQGADQLDEYITTDEDGSPDFDSDRAQADGVDPALITAAEAVEAGLEEADAADGKDDGQVSGAQLRHTYPDGCIPSISGQPITELSPGASSVSQDQLCKPQVQASSSQRIDRDPVINGIKYRGYHKHTESRHVVSAICAFYSWSIIHHRVEDIWVLTDFLQHPENPAPDVPKQEQPKPEHPKYPSLELDG